MSWNIIKYYALINENKKYWDIFKNLIINPNTKNDVEIHIFLSNEIITNNTLPEYRNKIYVDLKSSKKNKSLDNFQFLCIR